MTKKTRFLLIAAVFPVAAAAALLLTRAKPEEEPEAPHLPDSVVLTDFNTSDLRSITVENTHGGWSLVSSDGETWISPEISWTLDNAKVTSAVSSLNRLRSIDIVTEELGDPSEFGFPGAVLILKDREGNSSVVEIGNANPAGSRYYARSAGSQTVVLLSSYSVDRLFTSVSEFRDMSLPVVNLEEINSLYFRRNGREFRMQPRNTEDPYRTILSPFEITSPWNAFLEDSELQKLLTEEAPLPTAAAEYLDSANPADPALGLDESSADRLILTDAQGGVMDLIIGAGDGAGRRYVRLGDRDTPVFLLNETDLKFVSTDPFRLISKFVFLGSIDRVSQVKVEYGPDTWLMTRTELGDPEDIKDDQFKVNTMEIPQKEFSTAYQKMIGIMYEGEITEKIPLGEAAVRMTVTHPDFQVDPVVIRYWDYDDIYYQVSVDGGPLNFLAGRYQIDILAEELAALSQYGS